MGALQRIPNLCMVLCMKHMYSILFGAITRFVAILVSVITPGMQNRDVYNTHS
jgi:hypothetical protein